MRRVPWSSPPRACLESRSWGVRNPPLPSGARSAPALCRPPFGGNVPSPEGDRSPIGRMLHRNGRNIPQKRRTFQPSRRNIPPIGRMFHPNGRNIPQNRRMFHPDRRNIPPIGRRLVQTDGTFPQTDGTFPQRREGSPGPAERSPRYSNGSPEKGRCSPSAPELSSPSGGAPRGGRNHLPAETDGFTGWMRHSAPLRIPAAPAGLSLRPPPPPPPPPVCGTGYPDSSEPPHRLPAGS